ncbi:MAG: ATP synthase complex assembly protein atp12, partial [Thelocarpon superellum]
PLPAVSQHDARIARRRSQAELIRQGKALRAAEIKPGGAMKKRFWKDVTVKEVPDGWQIHLDSRPVRTPSKTTLTIPPAKPQLAAAVALEWDLLVSAQQALKQHLIPLTSLVSRAEDIREQDRRREGKTREEIVDTVMRYLDTDTLLCWAPETLSPSSSTEAGQGRRKSLREIQIQTAQPILAFLSTHVWPGVEIHPVTDADSIVPKSQPRTTRDIIRGWVTGLPAYELAGLERAVLAGKGLLTAARLIAEWSPIYSHLREDGASGHGPRFGIEEAAEAVSTEVRWQTDVWGEVEDTHDVEKEDLRRQLGSVILLVSEKRQ